MKGVRSWRCDNFHPLCPGVTPIDIGGFAHLWCPQCRILVNLEAVGTKDKDYIEAKMTAAEKKLQGGV